MKIDIYKEVKTRLNKRRRSMKFHVEVKLVTAQEIIDLLAYLEELKEPIEYIEETLVEKLDFK